MAKKEPNCPITASPKMFADNTNITIAAKSIPCRAPTDN